MRTALSRRALGASLLAAVVVTGCGFKLRGSQTFAFERIAITPDPGGAIAQALRSAFGRTVQVVPADAPAQRAQVVLHVLSEKRDKVVVGSNASGQVREFQLRLRVQFSASTPQGKELLPIDSIALQRDFSYNESAALAKETEEALLFRDMQNDIVAQILRRLATFKPTLHVTAPGLS